MKEVKNENKFKWSGFFIMLGVSLVISGLFFWFQLPKENVTTGDLVRCLSNGFFVSAVLYIGCGLLMIIGLSGTFIGLQYLGYSLMKKFAFTKKSFEKRDKDYNTFKIEKEAEASEKKGPNNWRMFFVGLVNLVVSVIFTFLFYQ